MATRAQIIVPIAAAAFIVGIVGMLNIPSDAKLESVEFPMGTIKLDDQILQVQIADNDSLRMRGLMFQEELPYDQGMLFVFDKPDNRPMWMLNMQFPIDVIWFDVSGDVTNIEKNVPPCLTTIEVVTCRENGVSGNNAKYVLEVTAGFVECNFLSKMWFVTIYYIMMRIYPKSAVVAINVVFRHYESDFILICVITLTMPFLIHIRIQKS